MRACRSSTNKYMHFFNFSAKHFQNMSSLSECINSITFEIMNANPKLSQRFKESMMVPTLKSITANYTDMHLQNFLGEAPGTPNKRWALSPHVAPKKPLHVFLLDFQKSASSRDFVARSSRPNIFYPTALPYPAFRSFRSNIKEIKIQEVDLWQV